MANVITTSSGDLRSSASRPLRPLVRCETTCLIRSTDMVTVLRDGVGVRLDEG